MSVRYFTAEDLQVTAKQLESKQSSFETNCQVLLYVAAANAAAYALQYKEDVEITVPIPDESNLPERAFEEVDPWGEVGHLTYNCVTNGGRNLLSDDVKEALLGIAAAKIAEGPAGNRETIRARVLSLSEALAMARVSKSGNPRRVVELEDKLEKQRLIAEAAGEREAYDLALEAGSSTEFEEAAPGLFIAKG